MCKEYVIEGRQTKMGAYTAFFNNPFSRDTRIKTWGHSRTGRHWKESVCLEEDEIAYVYDITNSGKHRCYRVRLNEGRFIATSMLNDLGQCMLCREDE